MPRYRAQVLRRLKDLDEGWKAGGEGGPGLPEPFILVTTSAMEVGVDVSSDVMVTDLCDCDSFVQRIGRCARRPGESGEVYLIADDGIQVRGRGRLLWDLFEDRPAWSSIDAALRHQLNAHNTISDLRRIHLRLEYLQDQSLYRYVYDFVEENRELWEKGVLITREWEPSIALVRSVDRDGENYIGGIPARDFWRAKEIKEKLLRPISAAESIAPYCAWILETYDEGNQLTQRLAIGGSKQRTLTEALQLAGISARPQKSGDPNKIRAVYGIGLPLILLLLSHASLLDRIFPSEAEGVVDGKLPNQWATKTESDRLRWPGYTRPPSQSLLDTFGVLLKKDSGATELPVYWFEPRNEDVPGVVR